MNTSIIISNNIDKQVVNSIVNIINSNGYTTTKNVDIFSYTPNKSNTDIIITDVDSNNASLLTNLSKKCKIIILSSNYFNDIIYHLSESNLIQYIIGYADNNNLPELLLQSTINKLSTKNIFGLSHYLSGNYTEYSADIFNSRNRYSAIDDVAKFAVESGVLKTISKLLYDLIDELLMNAIFDAHPIYGNQPRDLPVILKPNEKVILKWGISNNYLGVSITDPHGGLNYNTILNYLSNCIKSKYTIVSNNMTKGYGAGLGLFKVIRSCNSFIINVDPNKKTETIGLYDISFRPKEFKLYPKSLTYFSL